MAKRIDVIRLVVAAGMAGAVLSAGGCGSQEQFRPPYLRGDYRIVGGGTRITWEAPGEGTVYLVEKKTGRLVETRSLEQGEAYTFTIETIVEAEDIEQILGIDISDAEFLLYFEPAQSQPQAGSGT